MDSARKVPSRIQGKRVKAELQVQNFRDADNKAISKLSCLFKGGEGCESYWQGIVRQDDKPIFALTGGLDCYPFDRADIDIIPGWGHKQERFHTVRFIDWSSGCKGKEKPKEALNDYCLLTSELIHSFGQGSIHWNALHPCEIEGLVLADAELFDFLAHQAEGV